ncbi:MAG: uracil-DNA glycosylase [Candidatus Dojkabacteria bacterium]|nr:uracil-DNA glycosylase [Candidatus Dojkabacteria bacterium]
MNPQIPLFEPQFPLEKIVKWVGKHWAGFLQPEFESPYMLKLFELIREDKKTNVVVPEFLDVFKLYRLLPPKKVKVVILSQSPYPSKQADGIAFSAKYGRPLSLRRIQKSLQTEKTDLQYLVEQGVWLQNTILTANTKNSLAHQNWGWERFVFRTLQIISDLNRYLVWITLGSEASKLIKKLPKPSHQVFKVSHPVSKKSSDDWSFKTELEKANEYLRKYGEKEIQWSGLS